MLYGDGACLGTVVNHGGQPFGARFLTLPPLASIFPFDC